MKISIPLLTIVAVAIIVLVFTWIAAAQKSEDNESADQECCQYPGYN